jgi:predicted phosphate transport protein (TIGR00153 family)
MPTSVPDPVEFFVRMRFTPRETSFYDMFSASADNIVMTAGLLAELVTVGSDRSSLAARIRDAEHTGDDITHRILRQLNSTFVTPFEREDIYRLASRLDDVLDFIEAAADLIVLYQLEELPQEICKITDVLHRAAKSTAEAMPRLRSLKDLSEYWIEVNELENEADQVHRRLVARLFSGSYEALDVLKLKEVAEELEAAADAFEHVADTVQTIVVKES